MSVPAIIIAIVVLVVAVVVTFAIATNIHEQKVKKVIGDADAKAKEITSQNGNITVGADDETTLLNRGGTVAAV